MAITCLAAALAFSPLARAASQDSELECAFGEALLAQGDPAGAIEHLVVALEMDPGNERARLMLARARAAAADTAGALAELDALLELYPGDPALLREQAYVMILDEDYMWAVQALQEALAQDPDDTLAQLYLGYAAIALESPADAVEPLAKASSATGGQGSTASYLSAVALGRTGDLDAAFAAVEDAIAMGLASDPWAEAAMALRSALRRELVPFDLVDLALSAGLFWDSNVALFSQDIARIMHGEGTQNASFGTALSGSILVRPFRGRNWALGAGGSVYQSFNFSPDMVDYNTTVYGITAEMVRTWQNPMPLRSVSLRYLQSLVCLWGGPLVDFDNYYRFSNSFGMEATAEFAESDWGATRVRMLWRYALFTDYGRDNMGFSASLNQTFFMWDRKLKIALDAGVRTEHADDLAWDRIGPRVFVGVSLLLPLEIQALAAFSYEHMDHHQSGPETRWAKHRVDDTLVYSLSLSHTFLEQLTLGAGVSYMDNRSTLRLSYDYDRVVVSVTLTWRLP